MIRAIMLRELLSRYTGDKVGYAWSLLIPLMWVILIWFFFLLFNRPLPINTDVGSFILTGLVPYISFRYTLAAVMRSKLTYHNLFIIPRLNPEIVCFAVGLLEIGNAFVIYSVLALGNLVFFGQLEIANPFMIALGLFLACLLGTSMAYMIVSVIKNVRFSLRAMQILVRPMFYLSGVFFVVSELPLAYQDWLWYNPILHAVEITRTGAFGDFSSQANNAWMPLFFSALFLAIGAYASQRGGIWAGEDSQDELPI
tara:strand:+ start:2916 stop:3680 length:765 start_codon:yes stop_codon:yes gene_type:complete